MAGPGHGAPGVLGPVYLEGTTPRSIRKRARTRRASGVLQAVLVSGRHRQPLHAGNTRLDPRRRRIGVRPVSCLRSCLRQPRSDRRGRRRRRRIRDRPAGDFMAHQQVPESRFATARFCRSCTSTATRSTIRRCSRASATKSWRACSAATAGRRTSWKARIPTPCTRRWPRRWNTASRRSGRIQQEAPRDRRAHPPALANDRAAFSQGLDARRRKSTATELEGFWRAHQVPLPDVQEESRAVCRCSKNGCGSASPRSCSTPTASWSANSKNWRPTARAA